MDPRGEIEESTNKEEVLGELLNVAAGPELDLEVKQKQSVAAGNDDEKTRDGYSTPTSPRHRIPLPLRCPPAPRKPPSSLRSKRKKKRRSQVEAKQENEIFGDNSSPVAKKSKNIQWTETHTTL
ncbi:cyclin-dependent protein kinase inhibitor SMR3-like [Zingiber officinale]|uniref:cyclin-dependent protein kinase inhibitor SMR3-like n=1 Tax=Zingiber officinale TaxID=94328 RepID=UPI001C4AED07|nr:cyclin-dependent protein kinase inhibitor SMR3-like [Zingiber officinale]